MCCVATRLRDMSTESFAMPCYLFTWHTYGSWLPDRQQGYVHWNRGLSASSLALAACYREQQKDSAVRLSLEQQELLIKELLLASNFQRFTLHAVACEDSHTHVLISWKDSRQPEVLKRSMRHSMSKKLNQLENRRWFSRGGNTSRVRDQRHFDYLYKVYLPSHNGMKWNREKGIYR